MIIVGLMGGLGNQLFQYAMGRQLALANNTELMLDISRFRKSNRSYKLDKFNISAQVMNAGLCRAFQRYRRNTFLAGTMRLFGVGRIPKGWEILTERKFGFDPEALVLAGNTYIEGYWLSDKYFDGIGAVLRKELTLREPCSDRYCTILDTIGQHDAISLHVRRGDFVTDPENRERSTVCSIDYYHRGLDIVAEGLSNPRVFIFSDDCEWVKANIQLQLPVTYVVPDGQAIDYEELYLMSQCKRHITANSTFSWWGAWLSDAPGKMVIAPERWFSETELDICDLIPSSWVRIPLCL